ncbi:MAG: flagellar motor protein MotB, partial [Lacinutrix sp.]
MGPFSIFFCCKPCLEAANNEAETKSIAVEPEAATKNMFSIIDSKSSLKFNANENLNFKGSTFSILEPVFGGLKLEIARLATYLSDNPNKTVD